MKIDQRKITVFRAKYYIWNKRKGAGENIFLVPIYSSVEVNSFSECIRSGSDPQYTVPERGLREKEEEQAGLHKVPYSMGNEVSVGKEIKIDSARRRIGRRKVY